MKRNIAVMGGSFNPPTIAHLKLVQTAMDAMDADRGYLVPVSHAYLKRKMVRSGCGHMCIPTDMRLRMLRGMAADDTRLEIYTGELNQPYAVTTPTMEHIQRKHPDERVWFVVGEDKLDLIALLTRKFAFLPRFGAVVSSRGGDLERRIAEHAELLPCRDAIAVVESPQGIEGISSTAVREHLFEPDGVAEMLHPAVLEQARQLRAESFPKEVTSFRGEYDYLGNDYPVPVTYRGVVYPSAENAFQASKTDDPSLLALFARVGARRARNKGGTLTPRACWEKEKDAIMRQVVSEKFRGNPDLIERLLATGDLLLVNGERTRGHSYWGVDTFSWEGENRLGTILMELRSQWREEQVR